MPCCQLPQKGAPPKIPTNSKKRCWDKSKKTLQRHIQKNDAETYQKNAAETYPKNAAETFDMNSIGFCLGHKARRQKSRVVVEDQT